MRIPFSYRQNFFKAVLITSVIGHGVFFLQAGFFAPKPQYAVESAPSSMEVMIVKQEIKEEKIEKEERVFVAKAIAPEMPKVAQREEKKENPKKEIMKSVVVPPMRGAITEAKPAYLKNPAPLYPNAARENGWQGVVILKVLVQKDGTAGEVVVEKSSGHQILDVAALNTVKKWHFLPSRIGNIALISWVQIPIRFILENQK